MLITRPDRSIRQRCRGFAIVSAIFILVALAALGAFIATVSTTQHIGSALDVNGARAYQAARAGAEWGVAQALASSCVASTNIGSVNNTAVTVACVQLNAGDTVEAGLGAIYSITAVACNQPVAGACPGTASAANYVERRIAVVVERP